MIEGGDVLVNWKEMKSANSLLKGGDIVTIRGKGRLEVTEVETTSKGKFRVKMTKFVLVLGGRDGGEGGREGADLPSVLGRFQGRVNAR